MMAAICRRAGIVPIGRSRRKIRSKIKEVDLYFGFHALRHFMASYLNDTEKAGTKTLQRLLRHKSQRTTEIYLHQIDNAQKAVMEAIEGKFTVVGNSCGSDRKPQHEAATTAEPGSII
jgi:integrase